MSNVSTKFFVLDVGEIKHWTIGCYGWVFSKPSLPLVRRLTNTSKKGSLTSSCTGYFRIMKIHMVKEFLSCRHLVPQADKTTVPSTYFYQAVDFCGTNQELARQAFNKNLVLQRVNTLKMAPASMTELSEVRNKTWFQVSILKATCFAICKLF